MADTIQVVITLNRFPELQAMLPREVDARIDALAHLGRNYAVTSIQRGGGGRSLPGEPPKTDTGTLAGSITVQPDGPQARMIAVGADYAPHLEYGTRRGLAPRPFMGPMALWLETQVVPVFRDLVVR